MTITDNYLYEITKAANNESYVIPSYQAVGTSEVASISTSATALDGEIGSRTSGTLSRSLNELTFSSTRTTADVVSTATGDTLKSTGVFSAATASTFLFGVPISGITQTTNFDIEFVTTLVFDRS